MSNIKMFMEQDGFIVLKNALSMEMVESYRKMIGNYFGVSDNYDEGHERHKADAFNTPELFELHKLFQLKKFTKPMQELTDNKLMYLHHGDIHLNFTAVNLHEDVQERGTDTSDYSWQEGHPNNTEPYKCYTVAIYLQDHDDGSGLSVMKGSHKLSFTNMIDSDVQKLNKPVMNLHTNAGDIVVFDCRLLHKGNKDSRGNRRAIYFRMGQGENIHSENHVIGAVTRQQKENGKSIKSYKIHSTLQKVLDDNSIKY